MGKITPRGPNGASAPDSKAAPQEKQEPVAPRPKAQAEGVAAAAKKGEQLATDHASFANANVSKTQDAQAAEGKPYLMCPVIGSLIAEGSLHQDAQGNVSLKELNDAMVNRLGISPARAAVTVGTAVVGNHASDLLHVLDGKLNLKHLGGSLLDHRGQGDTRILEGGKFNEDKFQALIRHSKDGKSLTAQDFSEAIVDQLKLAQPGIALPKASSEDVFEMGALINTFGTEDADGTRRIGIDTLRDLYQHRKLPAAQELMSRPDTGVLDHLETMGEMWKDIGKDQAHAAFGGDARAAGKGACPYLNQLGGSPVDPSS